MKVLYRGLFRLTLLGAMALILFTQAITGAFAERGTHDLHPEPRTESRKGQITKGDAVNGEIIPDAHDSEDRPGAQETPPAHPRLGPLLNHIAGGVGAGTNLLDLASQAPISDESKIAVGIYFNVDDPVKITAFLTHKGITPTYIHRESMEAWVPPNLLRSLAEQEDVIAVRARHPAAELHNGNNVQKVQGANSWIDAGYKGRDVRVGIIDVGFQGIKDLMGVELPPTMNFRCYVTSDKPPQKLSRYCDEIGRGDHGTAVAEALIDVAPQVELFISNPVTLSQLQDTVDWMIDNQVSVINYSAGRLYDGPGDGTSLLEESPLNAILKANEAGIIWINAAGNQAQMAWMGNFSDPNNNQWLNFSGDDETLGMTAFPFGPTTVPRQPFLPV